VSYQHQTTEGILFILHTGCKNCKMPEVMGTGKELIISWGRSAKRIVLENCISWSSAPVLTVGFAGHCRQV